MPDQAAATLAAHKRLALAKQMHPRLGAHSNMAIVVPDVMLMIALESGLQQKECYEQIWREGAERTRATTTEIQNSLSDLGFGLGGAAWESPSGSGSATPRREPRRQAGCTGLLFEKKDQRRQMRGPSPWITSKTGAMLDSALGTRLRAVLHMATRDEDTAARDAMHSDVDFRKRLEQPEAARKRREASARAQWRSGVAGGGAAGGAGGAVRAADILALSRGVEFVNTLSPEKKEATQGQELLSWGGTTSGGHQKWAQQPSGGAAGGGRDTDSAVAARSSTWTSISARWIDHKIGAFI